MAMNPSAVFNHGELKASKLGDYTWEKLHVDKVTASSFDHFGRYCALYFNYNAIELWDFSSIPVPVSTLFLPRHLSHRFEGICYALTWSPCSTKIIGVFGSKLGNRRRINTSMSTSDESASSNKQFYKPYYMVVWDVVSRNIVRKFRYLSLSPVFVPYTCCAVNIFKLVRLFKLGYRLL
jgi:hypothetical protein